MTLEVAIEVDGRRVVVAEGTTVLEAAKAAGIQIPTLCHHASLEPSGACRICTVEVEGPTGVRLVVACAYPASEGLRVRTRSPRIDKLRRGIVELSGPLVAAENCLKGKLRRLAEEYEADPWRFAAKSRPDPDGCTLCGLCVSTCDQVVGANAIGFVGRGIERQVVYFPPSGCDWRSCKKCFSLCFTGKIASEAATTVFPEASIEQYLQGAGVKRHSLRDLFTSRA